MLPKSVQVGPINFGVTENKLEFLEECYELESTLFGSTNLFQQKIFLNPELELDQCCETLLHEILHCIWHQTGLKADEDQEEQIVRVLSPNILDLFRRNPQLVKFLLKEK